MGISGVNSELIHAPSTAAGVKEPLRIQRGEDTEPGRAAIPERDAYVPEEGLEPSGRYWLGKGDDGKPAIYFDDPERAAESPEASEKPAGGPEEETSTCNTDAVDREIQKLRKEKEELEQCLQSETDETKIKALERKLAQVESELRRKDNDTYRRRNAAFS